MITRILFTAKMSYHHRKKLREFQKNKDLQSKTVQDLNCPLLKHQGIKILALDMDGVLASYGQNELESNTHLWLKHCIEHWGSANIFIYSNRPNLIRKNYFMKYFPGLGFVEVSRKKPYPDGLYQIMTKTHSKPEEILVVDDRLMTGILASIIVGTKAQWITKPMISLYKRPLTELFFMGLRVLERGLLR